MSDLEKLFAPKNHVMVHFTPWKLNILQFLYFSESMTLNRKFHYVSNFELKKIQGVSFLNRNSTTRQFLIWNFYNASDFE